MTTLVISCASIQGAPLLAMAARRRAWEVHYGAPEPSKLLGEVALYTSTQEATAYVARYDLALIEPPLDLLARVPMSLLLRRMEYASWGDLGRVSQPLFIKPADPLNKVFDAVVYRERDQIRASAPPGTAVLVSDVVEWTAEYRCFVLNGRIETVSPYMYRAPSSPDGSDYQLLSKGRDGKEGTADDIVGDAENGRRAE